MSRARKESTPGFAGRPKLRTKFYASIASLAAGEQPWEIRSEGTGSLGSSRRASSASDLASSSGKASGKAPSGPRQRYFLDLLCLPVEQATLSELLNPISARALLSSTGTDAVVRDNIGSLWREASRVWREGDATRSSNAVEMLHGISGAILSKRFSNYAFDVIHVLAGGMDEADNEFGLLVNAIDDALQEPGKRKRQVRPDALSSAQVDAQQQRRVLQLAILWLSHVGSTSLAAYFAGKRDLYASCSSYLSRNTSLGDVYDAAILLGLLASLGLSSGGSGLSGGSGSGAHAYARRMRDWVDEECMIAIRNAAAACAGDAVAAYVEQLDDSAPSFASSMVGVASLKWLVPVTSGPTGEKGRTKEGDFGHLPPAPIAILLPVLLLARSNPLFVDVLLRDNAQPNTTEADSSDGAAKLGNPQLSFSLLSLSTYLASHSASSKRGRAYAHVGLLLLIAFAADQASGTVALLQERDASLIANRIRVCRQKPPPLPMPVVPRDRLIQPTLDAAVLFLRHNLSRKLDTTGHLLALRLLRASIALLAGRRARIHYHWTEAWRAMLGLASFTQGRYAELRSGDCKEIGKSVIATLALALLRSDEYLPSPKEVQQLLYEVVRSSLAIRKLVALIDGGASVAALSPQSSPITSPSSHSNGVDNAGYFDTSALGSNVVVPHDPRLHARVPGWKIVERVLLAVEARVEEWGQSKMRGGATSTGLASLRGLGAAIGLASPSKNLGGETGTSSANSTPIATTPKTSPSGGTAPAPDIKTIFSLLGSIDLEALLVGSSANQSAQHRRDEDLAGSDEWLDSVETQVHVEVLREAVNEDVRFLITPK
ncbi:hypothetical protein IE81DRAFT_319422 [Ceraceosorus guamensis]|uniref:Armadillo-like helical domain-containing protein n=1 Tax=Ceraceosorus guamensis TaxID=1522189 RepID=A0A316WBM3_9BASI|nr:hypothetical protein IE81DRAFT_319422 [Ceraceosorus guamensis]PWN46051.1 hypothetical protein IE81DRAFT_319422 [Ceraceosorus guamensis]